MSENLCRDETFSSQIEDLSRREISSNRAITSECLPKESEPGIGRLFGVLSLIITIGDHVPIVITELKALDQLRFADHQISSDERRHASMEIFRFRHLPKEKSGGFSDIRFESDQTGL